MILCNVMSTQVFITFHSHQIEIPDVIRYGKICFKILINIHFLLLVGGFCHSYKNEVLFVHLTNKIKLFKINIINPAGTV